MKALVPGCVASMKSCYANGTHCNISECDTIYDLYDVTNRSTYDVRAPASKDSQTAPFELYLNRTDIQKQLGVEPFIPFASCSDKVGRQFGRDALGYTYVPGILAKGIRVLIYAGMCIHILARHMHTSIVNTYSMCAGDADFICNWYSNEAWTLQLDWPGKCQFGRAPYRKWSVCGSAAGKVRSYQNFTLVQVYQAGHEVPMYQPLNSLEMFKSWIRNVPIA